MSETKSRLMPSPPIILLSLLICVVVVVVATFLISSGTPSREERFEDLEREIFGDVRFVDGDNVTGVEFVDVDSVKTGDVTIYLDNRSFLKRIYGKTVYRYSWKGVFAYYVEYLVFETGSSGELIQYTLRFRSFTSGSGLWREVYE